MVRVRAHISRKPSHGSSQLLREIAQIESECEVPEGMEGFDETPLGRRQRVGDHQAGDLFEEHDAATRTAETV